MNRTITWVLSWVAVMGIGTSSVQGQEKNSDTEGKKKFTRVNLLPIGDFPVSGAVIVNGYPVMVVPKPSELVPTPVFVKEGKEYKSLSLIMNSPSQNWRRPSGSVLSVLQQKDGQYSNYLTVTLPEEKEDVTVFMLRNKSSKSWIPTPRTVIFKNGISTFPLGSARLINFCSVPVQAVIGDKRYTVPSQSFRIFPNPGTDGKEIFFTYKISVKIMETDLILANTAVSYDKQSRVNLVMYDRDGKSEIKLEGDDRPVKIVKYFELPYQAPVDPPTQPISTPPSS